MTSSLHDGTCAGPTNCTCATVIVGCPHRGNVKSKFGQCMDCNGSGNLTLPREAMGYNECAREVATDIDSRGPGLSDFPQRSGSLRGSEGEAS